MSNKKNETPTVNVVEPINLKPSNPKSKKAGKLNTANLVNKIKENYILKQVKKILFFLLPKLREQK